MEHKQLLPSSTEDDVIDDLLEAKNTQLKQKIDGAIIAIIKLQLQGFKTVK